MDKKFRRIFVEKKRGFDTEANHMLRDLKDNLHIKGIEGIDIINRYDIEGLEYEEYLKAIKMIFSEPNVDTVYEDKIDIDKNHRAFGFEYLPGQYDQRADSAAQCLQILTQRGLSQVRTAKIVVIKGHITHEELLRIKNYCINPVDSRECDPIAPWTTEDSITEPGDVAIIDGFIDKDKEALIELKNNLGLAMDLEDIILCQSYFKKDEKRNPTITELKVIDTYWSDHCRHGTFLTKIEDISFDEGSYTDAVKAAFREYLISRDSVYGEDKRDISLMDIGTIAMKELRKKGYLNDLDISDEINACSIVANVDVDGETREWLIMFKNETHNHPTEIEPFGGAATCLGGAIRDPLSGRAYVYQAMRVTGSGDPRERVEDTLPGKLPQRRITIDAAKGYSSYGNQIGLATGHVAEIYDQGYVAKRMEIGAVIGATPKENVVREKPKTGDVVLLIGGKTGRDGCGGATGSSVEHNEESIYTRGAEVQKGNPPEERKLQRLFRNPEFSRKVKRCNDFGAGGVSVAVGELADSIEIELDSIPRKYEGLDGTELAISESQERMAVVINSGDIEACKRLAESENLEATVIARITSDNRLKMKWNGKSILDIERSFLDSNGVKKKARVRIEEPKGSFNDFHGGTTCDLKEAWFSNLRNLNVACQKGLVERFDSTIGGATVVAPFGGIHGLSPTEGMVAKIPVGSSNTNTCTIMAYGYDPKITKWSPFHGGIYSVLEAVSKVVAMGGNHETIRLTLQEYFEKLGEDPKKWGKPFAALLGAFYAQKSLRIPAIGGKDSMSGTFESIHVPPTLVTFAVNVSDVRNIVTPEFKNKNSKVLLIPIKYNESYLPDFDCIHKAFRRIHELSQSKKILAAHSVGVGGAGAAISRMAFGNMVGFRFNDEIDSDLLFKPDYGSIIVEVAGDEDIEKLFEKVEYRVLGYTQATESITMGDINIGLKEALDAWKEPLSNVFPIEEDIEEKPREIIYNGGNKIKGRLSISKPRVFIPIFPGTNCEYDTAIAFEKAGAKVETMIFRNLTPRHIEESIEMMAREIDRSQIIALAGGFSAGDEPDGSGKFIGSVFRNPRITESVMNLLKNRDGLLLGICNGFQALIKLGLLPFGEIMDIEEGYPTITFNQIGRHVSRMVHTKVVSNLSPWFNGVRVGDVHTIPVSHGEGRFVASEEHVKKLMDNGQIATQYVDLGGKPSSSGTFNPNGSMYGVEGITSPDGRILGKMGHSERIGSGLYLNVPGENDQRIFESGVNYYR